MTHRASIVNLQNYFLDASLAIPSKTTYCSTVNKYQERTCNVMPHTYRYPQCTTYYSTVRVGLYLSKILLCRSQPKYYIRYTFTTVQKFTHKSRSAPSSDSQHSKQQCAGCLPCQEEGCGGPERVDSRNATKNLQWWSKAVAAVETANVAGVGARVANPPNNPRPAPRSPHHQPVVLEW